MASIITNVERLPITCYTKTEGVLVRWQWKIFLVILFVNDFVLIELALWFAYWVRFFLNIPFFKIEVIPPFCGYLTVCSLIPPIWILIFLFKGLYDRDRLLGGTREYSELFNAVTFGIVIIMAYDFLEISFDLARGWLLLAWIFSYIFVVSGRFVIRRGIHFLRRQGFYLSRALIVGANDEGRLLAEQLLQWQTSGFQIMGFADKKIKPGVRVVGDLFCLGNMEQLDQVIQRYCIDEVIMASSAISSRDNMVDIFKRYGLNSNVKVRFSSGLYEIVTTGLTVNQFAYVPLVGVNSVRLTFTDQILKQLLDYSLSIPGVILFAPLMLVIAILVKLDSPGPIIHKRRVIGVNGRQFNAFKFRTMYINGDEMLAKFPEKQLELQTEHKIKDDPRITRLGHCLRKFSLDELPQLFNVLKGDMSLVGPRMITKAEVDKYDKWELNLLTVRPGITGLWQVSGRSNLSYEDRVRLDMYYIRNWNIWLDLQLLFQTIPAWITGRGAY